MLFAELIDVLEKYAIPIGLVLGVLIVLLVPSFRRGLIDSFKAGKKAGERLRGKEEDEEEQN